MGYLLPRSVWLRPNVAAVATVIVAAAIGGFLTQVKTPDGESGSRNIHCFQSASGSGLCIRENGNLVGSGAIISEYGGTIGWTVQTGANTACIATCTFACVFGFDDDADTLVDCADTSADRCSCSGPS